MPKEIGIEEAGRIIVATNKIMDRAHELLPPEQWPLVHKSRIKIYADMSKVTKGGSAIIYIVAGPDNRMNRERLVIINHRQIKGPGPSGHRYMTKFSSKSKNTLYKIARRIVDLSIPQFRKRMIQMRSERLSHRLGDWAGRKLLKNTKHVQQGWNEGCVEYFVDSDKYPTLDMDIRPRVNYEKRKVSFGVKVDGEFCLSKIGELTAAFRESIKHHKFKED